MLGVNTYTQEYIDACRARVDAQLAAYRALTKTAKRGPALDSFEPVFFNNMVLVLDSYFTHRLRKLEGKDGNALNEVRMLCASMLSNDDLMSADKTIKWNASESVLGYEIGDEIRVTEADFVRLSKAFFAEIESKFT